MTVLIVSFARLIGRARSEREVSEPQSMLGGSNVLILPQLSPFRVLITTL